MAAKNKKKNKYIVPIVIAVLVVLILFIAVVVMKKENVPEEQKLAEIEQKYQEQVEQDTKKYLSTSNELERMQFYCADFFKLINSKKYEEAYQLLNEDYQENYFPTLANFKKYFEEYFPSKVGLSYTNIERLGEIYVLNVGVKDALNGSGGHSFSMYVVIKENALNDYELSFSRNSAVDEEAGEEE
ncbi:MAG: hypothetical protein IJ867_00860 [Clostridia bacterium]|nr:hypothetical protein [Clostridia bacterium]